MRQIFTILLDSLRMLRAKKLFWVALGLSTLLGLVYLSISFTEKQFSVGFGLWEFESETLGVSLADREYFYVEIYRNYMNRLWLGAGAILLALISTVSIFPEFTREGAIEVSLSKPVSRLKLFVVKYVGCLFFVLFQMLLFASFVFAAWIWRLGDVNWTVFWLVPVVTFAFSLIHCVQVLVGIITRSSLVALLVGIVFWGMIWTIQVGQEVSYNSAYVLPEAGIRPNWETGQMEEIAEGEEEEESGAKAVYRVLDGVMTPLPKMREVSLTVGKLVKLRDSGSYLENFDLQASKDNGSLEMKNEGLEMLLRGRHSMAYYFLTSAGFNVVILGLACWVFVRRDY